MQKYDDRYIKFDNSDPNAVTGDIISRSASGGENISEAPSVLYYQQAGAPTVMNQNDEVEVTHIDLNGIEGQASFYVQELMAGTIDQNTTDIISYADIDKWDFEDVKNTVVNFQVDAADTSGHFEDNSNIAVSVGSSTPETIAQVNTTDSWYTFGNSNGYQYDGFQSFTLANSTAITGLGFTLTSNTTGTPEGATFRIETDNGGVPSGTLADANATNYKSALTTNTFNTVMFDTPFTLSAGIYHFVAISDDVSTNNFYGWYFSTSSVYSGGTRGYRSNDGAWESVPAQEVDFKIFGYNYPDRTESKIQPGCIFKLTGDSTIYKILNVLDDGAGDSNILFSGTKATGTYAIDWIRGNSIPSSGDNADKIIINREGVAVFESDGSKFDYDGSSLSGWIDGDIPSGDSIITTVDGRSCMRLTSISSATHADQYRTDIDISSSNFSIEFEVKIDYTNANPSPGYASIGFQVTATKRIQLQFLNGKLFNVSYSSGDEIGSDIAPLSTWLNFTINVNVISETFDVYKDGILVRSNISFNSSASLLNKIELFAGNATQWNIDYLKIGSYINPAVSPVNQYYTATTNSSGQINTSNWSEINSGHITDAGGYDLMGSSNIVTEDCNSTSGYSTNAWGNGSWTQMDDGGRDIFRLYSGGSGGHGYLAKMDIPTITSPRVWYETVVKNTSSQSVGYLCLGQGTKGLYWQMAGQDLHVSADAIHGGSTVFNNFFSSTYEKIAFDINTVTMECDIYLNDVLEHSNINCWYNYSTETAHYGWSTWSSGYLYIDSVYIGDINEINNDNFYSISTDARDSYKVFNQTGSVWRDIARDNSGTWQYNNNPSDNATETWADSTINSAQSAISQAIETHAANKMTMDDYEAISDTEWNAGGFNPSQTVLDLAITQYTNVIDSSPSVDNFSSNYTLNGNYQAMKISSTSGEYKVQRLSDTTTKFTKLSAGTALGVICTVAK